MSPAGLLALGAIALAAATLSTPDSQQADRQRQVCGAGAAAVQPPFRGRIEKIDLKTRKRMSGISWHRGCPVGDATAAA